MPYSGFVDAFDFSPGRASPRAPLKAVHDLSMTFPDNDSGFGSSKSRRATEDFTQTYTPVRLARSRSMSRINSLTSQEACDVMSEKSVQQLQIQLEDSEARRVVLMNKLKEAQATLELQNERLSRIENAAKDNTAIVEDLKFKEREYRKKIAQLQQSEDEKQMLQMENARLREEMQDRIDLLDFQLKSLKNQHQSTEDENERRVNLLDETTSALTLLEEENTRLQFERDKLAEELQLLKEAFHLSKSRYDSLELDQKSQRSETERLREENLGLNKRVHEMAGQMMELRNLLQAVKDDNERLSSSWQRTSQDRYRTSRQMEGYQDSLSEIKSRLSTAVSEKDRLFHEKLEINQKVQQLILEKEQLIKSKMVLEEQIGEQQKELDKSQYSSHRQDTERKHVQEELAAVKRVSEDLSAELSSVKAFYERALEQLSLSENSKKLQEQQVQLLEQERIRLQGEVDRLSKILDGRHKEDKDERQHVEDTILRMKKLQKANEEIRGGIGKQHSEMESWKSACERLTASVTRKETELKNLTDKCRELESQLSRVQDDLRLSRDKEEVSEELHDELERLRDENRRLLQEKAENEQILDLLETQRDVLTKGTESSLTKLQDIEQLSSNIDNLRSENELLRQKVFELEKVRDNLIKQKEDLLASSELIYKSQNLEDLEQKIEELREANKQLRDINEGLSGKLQTLERENDQLKQCTEESLKEEIQKLQEENKQLQEETTKLRHESHESWSQSNEDSKDFQKLRKERDALQKQVQLLNGQLTLVEGSKKRSDETAQKTQSELLQLKQELETTRRECAEAKRFAAQVKSLSEQLQKAKEKQESQERLINNMKEESLENVGSEIEQMREELQKQMGEIEIKEQTIESLERELQNSKETVDIKEHNISDLKKLVADLEQQISTLKVALESQTADHFADSQISFTLKKSGEKSLKDELEEAVRGKQEEKETEQREDKKESQWEDALITDQFLTAVSPTTLSFPPKITLCVDTTLSPVSESAMAVMPATFSSANFEGSAYNSDSPKHAVSEISALNLSSSTEELHSALCFPVLERNEEFDFIQCPGNIENVDKEEKLDQHLSSPTGKKDSASALLNLNIDASESWVNGVYNRKTTSESEGGSKAGEDDQVSVDFPPIVPPPVEQTKPRLAFAQPQPAGKSKARKLLEVRMQTAELCSRADTYDNATKQTLDLASAGASSQVDSVRQRLQAVYSPKSLLPMTAARPPTSQTLSKDAQSTAMSPKEVMQQPRKMLSDGCLTITTANTSSPKAAEIKFNVRKQESSTSHILSGSNISVNPNKLVDSDSKPKLTFHLQTLASAITNSFKDNFPHIIGNINRSVTGLPKSTSQIFTKTYQVSQNQKIEIPEKAKSSSVPSKSSSVRNFFASFANLEEEIDSKPKVLNPLSKSSSFSSFDDSVEFRRGPRKSLSVDSFQSLLEDSFTADESPNAGSDGSDRPSHSVSFSSKQLSGPLLESMTLSWEEAPGAKSFSSVGKFNVISTEPEKENLGWLQHSLEEGQTVRFKPATGQFLSKSLGRPFSPAAGGDSLGVGSGESEQDKPGAESGNRLQSLISKYRSHSTESLNNCGTAPSTATTGQRPLGSSPLSGKPAVSASLSSSPTSAVPKGRGFTLGVAKAPLLKTDSAASLGKPDASLHSSSKKMPPPPPPPKPAKSLTMKSLVDDNARVNAEARQQEDELRDSQEQSDINALIQKLDGGCASTKSLLSVHPPRITSKVIAGLLRSKKL